MTISPPTLMIMVMTTAVMAAAAIANLKTVIHQKLNYASVSFQD
jgi:hypothetical protein